MPSLRACVYRAIRDDEYPAAARLFLASLEDLAKRLNASVDPRSPEDVAIGYRHVGQSGIFRVAEIDGRLVALACATMRERQWFLSGFWTAPDVRLHGIGGPLLREVRDEGRRRGATRFSVWSSPDTPAIASYMKLGMLPGTQLFAFGGSVIHGVSAQGHWSTAPIEPEVVAALDRGLVGVRRDEDHRYFAGHGFSGALVLRDGAPAGYFYVHDGAIGPAGWRADDDADGVLALALAAAARHGEVQLTAPGVNHRAIEMALRCGLRLVRTSHLLWTEPIGAMERYLPSGPLLF